MAPSNTFRIAALAGDGIGPEVMSACQTVLDKAAATVGGFALSYAADAVLSHLSAT